MQRSFPPFAPVTFPGTLPVVPLRTPRLRALVDVVEGQTNEVDTVPARRRR